MSGNERRFYFGGLFGVRQVEGGIDLVQKPVDFFAVDDDDAERIMSEQLAEFAYEVAVLFVPRWHCMKNFEEMLDILRRDPCARLFIGAAYWLVSEEGRPREIDTLAITYLVRGCPSEEELAAIEVTEARRQSERTAGDPLVVSREISRDMLMVN